MRIGKRGPVPHSDILRGLTDALPGHQGGYLRGDRGDRLGGGQTLSWLWSADRLAAAGVGTRHDVAVARQARHHEHGRARRSHLLVRAALPPDVPRYPGDVEARLGVLGSACYRVRFDHPPLWFDDVDRPSLRPTP